MPDHLVTPPVGDGPWPGVVVLHEVFGVDDDIREHAGRLAAAGYSRSPPTSTGPRRALHPGTFSDLFGPGTQLRGHRGRPPRLAEREDCTGRVGVHRLLHGRRLRAAGAARGFDAAAPNYGPLPRDLEAALRGSCPLVASYGKRDFELPSAAAKLGAALERQASRTTSGSTPAPGHSFMNRHNAGPLNPVLRVVGIGYHQPSAEDAWGRILRFFDEHLRAPRPE